ncbi:MAG: isochorismatase family protein [Alphaproteobacteria bacterium GM7ARS4]|nr:isochorismatase family protein [Alphaproteobacteria bacterium GM7ARS4]
MTLLSNRYSCLILVDIQEKLLPVMADSEGVVKNAALLCALARSLDIPIIASQQYPQGLGETHASLRPYIETSSMRIDKVTFSAAASPDFLGALCRHEARKQLVIVGIEAHICVLQTALDLLRRGYQCFVVVDGVSSRKKASVDVALSRLQQQGCSAVTTEMVLFEWLQKAGTPLFKEISQKIRSG